MYEVLREAALPLNLPFSVVLCAVAIYWLLVALGALGFDMDADGDLDVDSGDGDQGGDLDGWFSHVLQFIHIGEVPLTIVLSVYALCAWTGSMIVNHYWTGGSPWLALAALLPNLLLSAVLTRYLTFPFKPLLRALSSEGEEHLPIVGRTCEITTSEANASFGQAQIHTKGAPLLINVRALESATLPRGATGLIVREDKEKSVYFVVPVTSDRLK